MSRTKGQRTAVAPAWKPKARARTLIEMLGPHCDLPWRTCQTTPGLYALYSRGCHLVDNAYWCYPARYSHRNQVIDYDYSGQWLHAVRGWIDLVRALRETRVWHYLRDRHRLIDLEAKLLHEWSRLLEAYTP